jgi:hypothetical protein
VKRPGHEKLLDHPILKFSGLSEHGSYAELKVKIQIYVDDKPTTFPVSTSYKSFKTRCKYDVKTIFKSYIIEYI